MKSNGNRIQCLEYFGSPPPLLFPHSLPSEAFIQLMITLSFQRATPRLAVSTWLTWPWINGDRWSRSVNPSLCFGRRVSIIVRQRACAWQVDAANMWRSLKANGLPTQHHGTLGSFARGATLTKLIYKLSHQQDNVTWLDVLFIPSLGVVTWQADRGDNGTICRNVSSLVAFCPHVWSENKNASIEFRTSF